MANVNVVPSTSTGIVVDLLNKDNYKKWSKVVQTYLIAQDLWDVVDGNYKCPENNEQIKKTMDDPSPKPEIGGKKESAPKPTDEIITDDKSSYSSLNPEDQMGNCSKSPPKPDNGDNESSKLKGQFLKQKGRNIKTRRKKRNAEEDRKKKNAEEDRKKKNAEEDRKKNAEEDRKKNAEEDRKKNAEEDIKTWRKKNAAALHVIQISCGSEALLVIMVANTAKVAWDTLNTKFNPRCAGKSRIGPGKGYDIPADYQPIYKNIVRGDWNAVKELIKKDHNAVTAKISDHSEIALHVAVTYGRVDAVKDLVEQMSEKELEIKQGKGKTALCLAASTGSVEMANCLIEKNRNLAQIPAKDGFLPVVWAARVGHSDMVQFLHSHTVLEDGDKNGAALLNLCILSRNFAIAFDLIKRYPRFTITDPWITSYALSNTALCTSETFRSRSHLKFWQNWIYNCIHICGDSSSSNDTRIKISEKLEKEPNGGIKKDTTVMISGTLRAIGPYIFKSLGIKQIYDLKLAHLQNQELLCCILESLKTLMKNCEDRQQVLDVALKGMFTAVKVGDLELVRETAKSFPELILRFDHRERSLFSYAVECRQAEIFSLVHGLVTLKEFMAVMSDDSLNSLIHVAGKLAPPSYLSGISGAALQMQRELQWFKEVESISQCQLNKQYRLNDKNMTARVFFSENHKELAKEGEKWMKEIASSCIFVAALIVTIMFAAAFIVPGGDAHEKKLSTISHEKWFLLYIISDAISLFSSTTSVLMFLGILTSRYYEEAFLTSLPTKLIIGLSTLFFSIATMMISFCSALYVMLQGQLTIIIPVILLASVPVTLFVKLQFPLLVEIFRSTYGSGIFTRKYENWLNE